MLSLDSRDVAEAEEAVEELCARTIPANMTEWAELVDAGLLLPMLVSSVFMLTISDVLLWCMCPCMCSCCMCLFVGVVTSEVSDRPLGGVSVKDE